MAKPFLKVVCPVVPGFCVCLLLQILLLFHPEINDLTDNESTNKVTMASAFTVPRIFWSAWIVVSLFLVCPALLEEFTEFLGGHNGQLAISGLRLVGIPMGIFLLIEFFGHPARIIAGWTVFHYSLALFLSCFFDYMSQFDRRC